MMHISHGRTFRVRGEGSRRAAPGFVARPQLNHTQIKKNNGFNPKLITNYNASSVVPFYPSLPVCSPTELFKPLLKVALCCDQLDR